MKQRTNIRGRNARAKRVDTTSDSEKDYIKLNIDRVSPQRASESDETKSVRKSAIPVKVTASTFDQVRKTKRALFKMAVSWDELESVYLSDFNAPVANLDEIAKYKQHTVPKVVSSIMKELQLKDYIYIFAMEKPGSSTQVLTLEVGHHKLCSVWMSLTVTHKALFNDEFKKPEFKAKFLMKVNAEAAKCNPHKVKEEEWEALVNKFSNETFAGGYYTDQAAIFKKSKIMKNNFLNAQEDLHLYFLETWRLKGVDMWDLRSYIEELLGREWINEIFFICSAFITRGTKLTDPKKLSKMTKGERERIQRLFTKLNVDGGNFQDRKVSILQVVTSYPEIAATAHRFLDKKKFVTYVRAIEPSLPSVIGSPVICYLMPDNHDATEKVQMLTCNLIMRFKLSVLIGGGTFSDAIDRRAKTDSGIMQRCLQTKFLLDSDKTDALVNSGLIVNQKLSSEVVLYTKNILKSLSQANLQTVCKVIEELGYGGEFYRCYNPEIDDYEINKDFTASFIWFENR